MSECAMCGWTNGKHDPMYFCGRQARDEERKRDVGIQRSISAADPQWADEAYNAGLSIATSKPEVVTDDIWDIVEKPAEPRAIAGVMRRLQAAKVIEPTGRTQRSRHRHRGPAYVWRSLVYRGPR